MTIPCRVLMIYPKFIPNSFWNYTEACELVEAKYPAASPSLPCCRSIGIFALSTVIPSL